jgi:hypothetical protein
MTREEAIAVLTERGLVATARDWALGESIVVTRADLEQPEANGIKVYSDVVWLLQNGALWVLVENDENFHPRTEFVELAACIERIHARFDMRKLDLDALLRGARAELAAETDSSPVPHVVELHRRGTREIFERASLACASPLPEERILGLRILRELGGPPPRFAADAVPLLLDMLERESDPAVLQWIVSAIGYQHMSGHRGERLETEPTVLASVLKCAEHGDERVRFHVAAELPSLINEDSPEPEAIDVLVALSADPDDDIRWYALAALVDDFGLVGRKDVTRALEARLHDEDDQIARAARRALDGGSWGEP